MTTANGRPPTTPQQAAPYYLDRGFRPLPIPFKKKGAVLDGWEALRPTADDLPGLFPEGQRLNIGLLLGEPSNGLVDADLDSAEAVRAAPHLLPATSMIHGRPGKPRSHYWYVVDAPPAKASAKFKDPDKGLYAGTPDHDDDRITLLELRSTGGQTVVPPSVHPTGEALAWDSFGEPARVSLDDLRVACCQVAAAALLARHWPGKGVRHELALALAGGLLRAGWSVEKAQRFLTAVYEAAQTGDVETKLRAVEDTAEKIAAGENVTGWPTVAEDLRGDGKKVVAMVCRWLGLPQGKAAPVRRLIASYRPFPLHTLPEPLRSLSEQGARSIGCDPAFIALPGLAVLASLIGNTRVIRLKGDWREPSVVWTGTVGDSSTLKSPAYKLAVNTVVKVQMRLLKEYRQRLEEYTEDKARYDREKKERDKNGHSADDLDRPEEPICPRLVVSDITIERLSEILEDNPRGVLVARDELSAWLMSFSRYKGGGGGSDVPNWLELHHAGTLMYDRKTGERRTIIVPKAAASVCGGIQPGTLSRAMTPEHREAGLGARLLLAMPPKVAKRWSEAEVSPEVKEAYERTVRKLLDLRMDTDNDGDPVPFMLRMTPEAKAAWVQFYDEWGEVQASVEGDLASAFGKLEAYAARFALLHHVVTSLPRDGQSELDGPDPSDPVGLASMQAGIELARWFAAEAERVYAMLDESGEQREERRLVDFIRSRGGRIRPSELHRANQRKYPTAGHAEIALDGLVTAGLGLWMHGTPGQQGGRPSKVFALRLTTEKTDETPDEDDPPDPPRRNGAPDETPPGQSPCVTKPLEGAGGTTGPEVPESQTNNVVTAEKSIPPSPESGGFVSSLSRQSEEQGSTAEAPDGQKTQASCPEVSSVTGGFVSQEPTGWNGRLVRSEADLGPVLQSVDESVRVGVDIETTGLTARDGKVRLLTLATDRGTYIVDCFAVNPAPLWHVLSERPLVLHNGLFDLTFLRTLGFEPGAVADTYLLSRLLHGTRRPRGFHGLEETVARTLGRKIDKTEQKSDWSGPLTAEQLGYAALDAEVLLPLHEALDAQVKEAGMARVADIENRCLPAVVWMTSAGVGFDPSAWNALAGEAEALSASLLSRLEALAPERPGHSAALGGAWNFDSPDQVLEVLRLLGFKVEATDDDTLAGVGHPFAEALRDYRSAKKLTTTYGTCWVGKALHDGRVYAGWQQVGADSGRMACTKPNLQNLPRDRRYRRCFVAPDGRVLVKADYSQIELRIAAKVANEPRMLAAYRSGEDLHTLTAQRVLGITDVTKEHRQLAKAVNFGLLYGMGVKGFRAYALSNYGLKLTEEEAGRYREAFFAAYPGLRKWHRSVPKAAMATRTLAGRRRQGIERYTEKLNTPVQGTGADGLKLALALLWERRSECPGVVPVLAVHDEIVVECEAGLAEVAGAWVSRAMREAMAPLIEPVPVEVEIKAGRTWAGD
jgi:DNA polymerase I-like protein with 3'-5' exonuclease and polymerase domains